MMVAERRFEILHRRLKNYSAQAKTQAAVLTIASLSHGYDVTKYGAPLRKWKENAPPCGKPVHKYKKKFTIRFACIDNKSVFWSYLYIYVFID